MERRPLISATEKTGLRSEEKFRAEFLRAGSSQDSRTNAGQNAALEGEPSCRVPSRPRKRGYASGGAADSQEGIPDVLARFISRRRSTSPGLECAGTEHAASE